MKTLLILLMLVVPVAASAAGGWSSRQEPTPSMNEIKSKIDGKNYQEAIDLLKKYVKQEPKNADAYNYLGFAYRKTGKLPDAFKAYKKALAIDPKHRGAHEYLGEAYLMNKEPEKAVALLNELKQICGDCEEYRDLDKAIKAAGR